MDSPGGDADGVVVVVVVPEDDDDAAAAALTGERESVDRVGIGEDISMLLPISVDSLGMRAARA